MSKHIIKIPYEVFSRIVGFYRPIKILYFGKFINVWNPGKQQELKDRVYFKISKDVMSKEERKRLERLCAVSNRVAAKSILCDNKGNKKINILDMGNRILAHL